ncbi:MAG TPA: hydrogenase [Euryarchaeota archaeon]|nr:hydrogenase [Euryarchaeota archaeon]
MHYKKLPKEFLEEFINRLRKWGEVHAPQKKGKNTYFFSRLDDPSKVQIDYTRTVIPPTKKYVLRPVEPLMLFHGDRAEEHTLRATKLVLFGVHACDINALKILDRIYLSEPRDSYYEIRRKNIVIIGISCMPDDYCFCKSMGTDYAMSGFDLFLHELRDGYLIRVGSPMGHEITWNISDILEEVSEEDIEYLKKFERQRLSSFKRHVDISAMPDILDLAYNSRVWERYSEKCLGCGNCTLVCPTCRCFETYDVWLSVNTSMRVRRYDSCFMVSHGLVAGGHNFRPTRLDRFRHRYYCKSYLDPIHGINCVGCGRCDEFCPAGIKHIEVLNEVIGEIYGR